MELLPGKVAVKLDMTAVAIPRQGVGLSEAQDKWLGAHPANKVLDDGGRGNPVLLVGREKGKQVMYELVPEMSPPGFTVQQAMAHMRQLGMDVRGEGPLSSKGYRTIVVFEPET